MSDKGSNIFCIVFFISTDKSISVLIFSDTYHFTVLCLFILVVLFIVWALLSWVSHISMGSEVWHQCVHHFISIMVVVFCCLPCRVIFQGFYWWVSFPQSFHHFLNWVPSFLGWLTQVLPILLQWIHIYHNCFWPLHINFWFAVHILPLMLSPMTCMQSYFSKVTLCISRKICYIPSISYMFYPCNNITKCIYEILWCSQVGWFLYIS